MNPLLNQTVVTTGKIEYSLLTPEHFSQALDNLIASAYTEHEIEMQDPDISYVGLFEDKYSVSNHLGEVWGILHVMLGVRDSDELRDLYEVYMPQVQEFYFKTNQLDTRPYNAFKQFLQTDEYKSLNSVKKRLVDKMHEQFIDSGIELPDDKKKELQEVQERLGQLGSKFSKNCHESEKLKHWTFTLDELDGVPEQTMKLAAELAKNAGEEGYRFSLVDGNAYDILNYCQNERTRKTVYEGTLDLAKSGDYDNTQIVHEIVKCKQEIAKILGYKNFATYNLKDKMAKNQDRVLNFITDLGDKAIFAAKDERKTIDQFGARFLNKPKIDFWDRRYVTQVYEKDFYTVDRVELNNYFKFDKVLNGLFEICNEMFGFTFEDSIAAGNSTEDEKWHPDVKIYDVYEHGSFVGRLQTDFFKRANKSGGAWMQPHRTYHRFDDGAEDKSIAHVVCNFTKSAEGEVQIIEHDDVITLFHEFGHALHHLASKVEKGTLGGCNVQWDGVELPSQFMENFCWDYDYLSRLTEHYKTGEILPREMFEKLYNAKNFNAATYMIRQVVLSHLDMLTYVQQGEIRSPMDIEQEVRQMWSVGEYDLNQTMVQHFSHIFNGGYSAGYYGYKWAEVLSADAYAAVKKDSALIQKYKAEILETGDSRDMMDNFVAFMGREPSVDALLIDCGLIQGE